MVTLQQTTTRKQNEEGERNGRADLFIATPEATAEQRAYLQATQRWPRVNSLNLTQALQDITSEAKRISYASDLKLGCLFVAPQKKLSRALHRKNCRTCSTTCRRNPAAPWPGISLTPIASCAMKPATTIQGSPYYSRKPAADGLNHQASTLLYDYVNAFIGKISNAQTPARFHHRARRRARRLW